MSTLLETLNAKSGKFAQFGTLIFVYLVLAFAVSGQSTANSKEPVATPKTTPGHSASSPDVSAIYDNVKIGTNADEVRKLLGKPTIDDDDGFFFDKGEEIVQIRLDENKKVRVISVTYSDNAAKAPKYSDVFGTSSVEPKPDGSVYNLVRYPEAGFWISYSRTAGDKPTVTVTMQKL